MEQVELVIDVSMHSNTSREKARAAVVLCSGFLELSLPGLNPGYMKIVGDGMDPIRTVTSIRKSAGEVKLVSVIAATFANAIWQEYNHCNLQKMLIEVSIASTNSPSEAMKIVAGSSGVSFVAFRGNDLRFIEITGSGIDVVKLVTTMRRKVGQAKLVNLTPITFPEAEGYWFNSSENNSAAKPRLIWCPRSGGEPGTCNYFTTNYGVSDLQKINIEVYGGKDSRTKAMAVVGGFPGVLSVAIIVDDEGYIEIIGRKIDAVGLINSIKKKSGDAKLLSLT